MYKYIKYESKVIKKTFMAYNGYDENEQHQIHTSILPQFLPLYGQVLNIQTEVAPQFHKTFVELCLH